jgi:1-deoxy-D-xylulose-5-phosphate reductoisomerase
VLYALCVPERLSVRVPPLRSRGGGALTFEAVDEERFPAFALGVAAGRECGTAPAVFNAAQRGGGGALPGWKPRLPAGIAER